MTNIHTQTDRHPAQIKEVAKACMVAGSWRLLTDHCDPATLVAHSQDISAQR